jgi:acetyl-CoA carboxylase carboxyl transferase subunit beta
MKGPTTTSTKNKKETPEGLWHKCIGCKEIVPSDENQANLWVCKSCGHHQRISAGQYFSLFFDDSRFFEFNSDMTSANPLGFVDTKPYNDRLIASQKKSGLKDAARTAYGTMEGETIVIAAMDFAFIGGSMGAVVGEKFARAIDKAMELNCPLMIISKSGGARMMEAAFSLMQMAKTSAKLSQLAKKGLPYISFLTDPTTGEDEMIVTSRHIKLLNANCS